MDSNSPLLVFTLNKRILQQTPYSIKRKSKTEQQ